MTQVLDLSWGDGPQNVPLRLVQQPSFAAGDWTPRPLRPVFPLKPDHGGGLLVLTDVEDDDQARRFLHRTGDGRVTWSTVRPDAEQQLAGWRVADFLPDGHGGIHLLEFLDHDDDRWFNRVRHVDAAGHTHWSRTGAVDLQLTDPEQLTGVYTGLQRPAGGPLWVIPHATSAGLLALDPDTGQTLTTARLKADIRNLVITPAGEALHARMIETNGRRAQFLAGTNLTTGQTRLTDPGQVPLLDLAGIDDADGVYACTDDGVTRLFPLWQLSLRGAVQDPRTGTLTIAYGTDDVSLLLIAEHRPDTAPAAARPLPLPDLDGLPATLIDVESGPRFVLNIGGSTRTAGTLVTVDGDGTVLHRSDSNDDVTQRLLERESRLDLTQLHVTPDGAILVPLSDPYGYRILRFQPLTP